MKVKLIRCGPWTSSVEERAALYIKAHLEHQSGDGEFWLITNLYLSQNDLRQSLVVDIIVVGPEGVSLIEIKHLDQELFSNIDCQQRLDKEVDRVNLMARLVKGRLSRHGIKHINFTQNFIFTKNINESYISEDKRASVQGIPVFSLSEIKSLLSTGKGEPLIQNDANKVLRALVPGWESIGSPSQKLERFNGYLDLQFVEDLSDPVRSVYRARKSDSREPVLLYIYDLSVPGINDAFTQSKREYLSLSLLQKKDWVPSIHEAFREADNYPGELWYFSIIEPVAPTLTKRLIGGSWSEAERISFTLACFEALYDLHHLENDPGKPQIIHRNLNPETIRVRPSRNLPLLTEFRFARIEGEKTIGGAHIVVNDFQAPEVAKNGLYAASERSDVYSLAKSLISLFKDPATDDGREVKCILETALVESAGARPSGDEILDNLKKVIGLRTVAYAANPSGIVTSLPPDLWDEGSVIEFGKGRYFRIDSRIGMGGIGSTFRMFEIVPYPGGDLTDPIQEIGPFVGKVFANISIGESALRSYRLVRAHSGEDHLSTIFEVAPKWDPRQVCAVLKWVSGAPLKANIGSIVEYICARYTSTEVENVLIDWLSDIADALNILHQVGLVHGDVSPGNIIVNDTKVTLIDYDLATPIGQPACGGGTPAYSSPSLSRKDPVKPSDDFFALAATIFHVVFGRMPFDHPNGPDKDRGVYWGEQRQNTFPIISAFIEKATATRDEMKFQSAEEVKAFLDEWRAIIDSGSLEHRRRKEEDITNSEPKLVLGALSEKEEPWLKEILRCYSGSTWGNSETRGLDSDFAQSTYVQTILDQAVLREIQAGNVSLIILSGNAGDGKTAFLQNLAIGLCLPEKHSTERTWEAKLPNGALLRVNMDASADYRGQHASELQESFFTPFLNGEFPKGLVHLIAINSGPLVEWLDRQVEETFLSAQFQSALEGRFEEVHERIIFVDLNTRSLVGGLNQKGDAIQSEFFDTLLDKMTSLDNDTWKGCDACLAKTRCTAFHSIKILRDETLGPRLRERLRDIFVAVHQRGRVHITARALREAISYVLFGTHYCTDYHKSSELRPVHYFDRAFDPYTISRQGEILREITILDPAWGAHPKADRFLLKEALSNNAQTTPSLASLRRQAYFEWSEEIRSQITHGEGLPLYGVRNLNKFTNALLLNEAGKINLCGELSDGLARLEVLPEHAYSNSSEVPFKIDPRTPTETVFWVTKPKDRFSLALPIQPTRLPIDNLHTQIILRYDFEQGGADSLVISLELFELLMAIKAGYQISDLRSDDTFANISVFKQRIAKENGRELFAWNPVDERIFKVGIVERTGKQVLSIHPLGSMES